MLIRIFLMTFLSSTLIAQAPFLSIYQPDGNTIDKQIEIKVKNLDPQQVIELTAETVDQKGTLWTSKAQFIANELGIVDLSINKPTKNSSYIIADPMGLFWSMLPASGDSSSSFKCKSDIFLSTISLYINNQLIDQRSAHQYLKKPEIQKIDVRENGIVGTLFIPKSNTPLPIIITLSGSNGGLSENRAKLLSSNGFAVLALGYFGVEGLPQELANIPLEYFEKTFTWLKKQNHIDGSRIGLYGISRGAELSLVLGSVFPNSIHAIVAVAPSSVIHGGLSQHPIDAWLYEGKPILKYITLPQVSFANGKGQSSDNPTTTRQGFLEEMDDSNNFAAATIPVEQIQCPILLISGGDDQMWPSEVYANQIITRLKTKESTVPVKHLNYPKAGHGINIPNLPVPEPTYYHPFAKMWFSMGGTRESDAQASFDAWNKLVAFFNQNLKSTKNTIVQANQEKSSIFKM